MNKSFTGLLIALTINIFAVFAFAAESPVILRHTLTGYNKGSTATILDYSLHVVNPGNTPIADLSLSLVSVPPLVAKSLTVSVGYLGPHQSTDLTLQIVTSALLDEERFSRIPLFWAGKYLDADGKPAEFPAKSKPGGGK